MSSKVHEQVVGFVQADVVQARRRIRKTRLEAAPDLERDILRCGNYLVKRGNFTVQETVIERFDNCFVQDVLHRFKVDDHAGYRIRPAFQCDLKNVVVSMAVWV